MNLLLIELNITIDTNLTTTDFLDVTLDLFTGKYYPYRKPNDRPLYYVNSNSNHPSIMLKQLPKMVSLSSSSINEDEFNKRKPLYEKALKNSGFDKNLKFESIQMTPLQNRQRKVVWFNPPFIIKVKTNIGQVFLKFPQTIPLQENV